ncbi:MAG TPA: DUF1573 domain-containing protein [Gemmataceae bacterium]
MRGFVCALAAGALCAAPAAGQEAPWANKFFTGQNPPPPVIVHDFGTVPFGTVLSHRFPITNIYAEPMQVMEIRKSCGCVDAVASKQVLQPRESGSIDLTMDARKFTGDKAVTVYVTFGPKYVSTAMLQVRAHSRADVMLNPGQLNFGVVPQGKPATQAVEVQYTGNQGGWRLVGVVDNGAPFDVRVQQLARQPGRIAYRVFVTLKAGAEAGPLNQEVVLKTNDPVGSLVRIHASGVVQAPLAVRPDVLKFDAVPVGGSDRQNVLVRGSRPFRIVKVEGAGDGIEVTLPPNATEVQIVTVEFKPTRAGAVRRQLRFVTDIDPQARPSVLVEGTAQ